MNALPSIDAIGVFARTLSRLMQAHHREMDLVGLFVVALVGG